MSGKGVPKEVLVSGGGAKNQDPMAEIRRYRAGPRSTTESLAPVDAKEAMAFAFLLASHAARGPATLPPRRAPNTRSPRIHRAPQPRYVAAMTAGSGVFAVAMTARRPCLCDRAPPRRPVRAPPGPRARARHGVAGASPARPGREPQASVPPPPPSEWRNAKSSDWARGGANRVSSWIKVDLGACAARVAQAEAGVPLA
jgi:hypothetical protein